MARFLVGLAMLAAGCASGDMNVGWMSPDPTPSPADPGSATLAAQLDAFRVGAAMPALAAGTFDETSVVEVAATGFRANGSSTPVETADRFHLGSCTKAMTATLIATFVDEGTLSFSTTLETALPGVPMNAAYRNVRIEQLLSHRSGTIDDGNDYSLMLGGGSVTAQRLSYTQAVIGRAPGHTPGTTFQYSNSGYVVAGTILERLTGSSWEQLMRDRIFEPLGMDSCGFGAPGSAGTLDQPWGHWEDGSSIDPGSPDADNPPAMGPAGTVHCSLEDWAKFTAEHLRGPRGASVLASAAAFAELHTSRGDGYALGWAVYDDGFGGYGLQHDGSNLAWYASAWVEPGAQRSWLAATNIANAGTKGAIDEATILLYQRDDGR